MRRRVISEEVAHIDQMVTQRTGVDSPQRAVNMTGGHIQSRRAPVEVRVHDTITLGWPTGCDVIPRPRQALNALKENTTPGMRTVSLLERHRPEHRRRGGPHWLCACADIRASTPMGPSPAHGVATAPHAHHSTPSTVCYRRHGGGTSDMRGLYEDAEGVVTFLALDATLTRLRS